MQASTAKGSHKRNLSNGTPDNSPLRRSKRQRSTANLKEASSGEESEVEDKVVPTPRKASSAKSTPKATKEKKTEVASSVKKEATEETELASSVIAAKKESVVKTEGVDTEVKTEAGAASTVQTKPAKKARKTKEEKEAEAMPLALRTQGLKMFVGAHVSAAKGVFNSITNSTQIGGNAFALFLKSQRKWDNPPLQDDVRDQFRKMCAEQNYDAAKHVLPHGSYLVNLAQNDKTKAKQAYDSFLDDLRRCEALGIKLYNFHPGSTNQTPLPEALARLASALTKALTETTTVIPVLETMCGHGNTIGGSLSEFRDLLALIPQEHHSRIGICIDTCHSFAAGYDLVTPEGFKAFLTEFDDLIGLRFLRALHLNDSKAPRGSKRDLHANIGTGFLGLRAFHNVMNEPRFEGLPMVLETPIDRVPGQTASSAADDDADSCASESEKKPKKGVKKGGKRPAGAAPAAVPDHGVWAREIKLLESLIGMDPEGEEFRALEKKLSEEGREMREKQMEQYERKLETEKKKEAKAKEKGQKSLMDMMKKGKA
ncbi:DNA-(apurinic or apyrimidinic site) lyase 1 [Penicillium cataractarum]|uniref:Apurinic-apyrimidinic endonuclease 1 n=1 Tax=Penicillium cataractarum TaxID=2100454 RepID=A0A9W9S0W5_9EURO|nr:DNA-(apurinic or apyrimidinic site) lyase 1 [Penicillium cataractarum]KAJ5369875.1 DNA-(apurinic or apyrimidinic site) lyase 1 [Penicillium cataractarum]